MDPREFLAALEELRDDHEAAGENPQSFNLKDCRNCAACMFSNGCEDCYRCTYCNDCASCSNSTHCSDCTGCHSSAYCTSCANCIGSKYLEYCESCADCNYCFGCVGLSKKDFHILNEPYDRNTYFKIVEKLRLELSRM